MDDDIVTRLREAPIYNCYLCIEYVYDDECDCASQRLLHNAAADEIERLQAVIKSLRLDLIACYGQLMEADCHHTDCPDKKDCYD